MDVKTARKIRNHVVKSVDELNEAVRTLQGACSDVEFQAFREACGFLLSDLWDLLKPIFREHRQLKPDKLKDIDF